MTVHDFSKKQFPQEIYFSDRMCYFRFSGLRGDSLRFTTSRRYFSCLLWRKCVMQLTFNTISIASCVYICLWNSQGHSYLIITVYSISITILPYAVNNTIPPVYNLQLPFSFDIRRNMLTTCGLTFSLTITYLKLRFIITDETRCFTITKQQ